MPLKRGYKQLIAEAMDIVETVPLADAPALMGRDDVLFVDIRDARELDRDGMIPGAFHAPRGMLEFWVDPESPYYKPVFTADKRLVLYCASAWRSALAARALSEMGIESVCHVEGGFSAWKKAGLPVGERPKKA
jgi:rhodanese-related sulfurtransferase